MNSNNTLDGGAVVGALVTEHDAATQRQIAALAAENQKLKEALAQALARNLHLVRGGLSGVVLCR